MILDHPKLLLIEIIFDETAILNWKKKSVDSASIDCCVSKRVELDNEAPRNVTKLFNSA